VPKKILAAPFFESFFTAGSSEKGFKNGATRKCFGPSYFNPTLHISIISN
jgi:hypothetical protein